MDDAQAEGWREPSHSTIEFVIGRAGLAEADRRRQPGPPVGKANRLRNKEGTGHGRPFPAEISDGDAHAAVQVMGTVAEMLLRALDTQLR